MNIPKDAVLLRIFFGEDDRFEHQPLYEAIVLKAQPFFAVQAGSAIPAVFTPPRYFDCPTTFPLS